MAADCSLFCSVEQHLSLFRSKLLRKIDVAVAVHRQAKQKVEPLHPMSSAIKDLAGKTSIQWEESQLQFQIITSFFFSFHSFYF